MKKILIMIIVVLLAAALLIPVPMHMEDGGTVVYQAILYSVSDVHRLNRNEETDAPYQEGIIIEILGIEVYHNVH